MSKPLTIDELKALPVGDWVWIVRENKKGHYYSKAFNYDIEFIPIGLYSLNLRYSLYGIEWTAYKNKEFAETKGELVELPRIEPFTTCNIETGEPTTAYNILYRDNASGELVIDCEVDKSAAEARLKELRGEK